MVTQLWEGTYTKVTCAKMLLSTNNNNIYIQWKIKDFAKIKSNLSLYFENLGTAIFKEHLKEFPL